MKIFFLDDSRERHASFLRNPKRAGHDITVAWNYADACEQLTKASAAFDVAYLDHDLEDPQGKTGEDVAKFIVAMVAERRPKFVVLHSFNVVGRWRMAEVLRDAGVRYHIELFHSGL